MSEDVKLEVRDELGNPAEVFAELPKGGTREQVVKTMMDKMPGHIALATDRANFPGCRLVFFSHEAVSGLEGDDYAKFQDECGGDFSDLGPVELVNEYFSRRANLLMLQMSINDGGITVLLTTQMDDEDIEEFQEGQRFMAEHMREYRAKKAKQLEEQKAVIEENKKLLALGKKVKDHNLLGKLKQQEEEIEDLKQKIAELEAP